jgi:hypothetical protein
VFEEKDSDKSAILLLTAFEKASPTTKAVDPGKGAVNVPALTAGALMFAFVSSLPAGLRPALLAIGGQSNEAALAQCGAQRIAVRAFSAAAACGAAPPVAKFAAVEGCADLHLSRAIGSPQQAVQRMASGLADQGAVEAGNPVLAGVADLVPGPLCDVIPRAAGSAGLRLLRPLRSASFRRSPTLCCQTRRRG